MSERSLLMRAGADPSGDWSPGSARSLACPPRFAESVQEAFRSGKGIRARRMTWAPEDIRQDDALELFLEPFDLAGPLAQLRVGGPLADPGQGPADGVGPVGRDARGDQRVHGLQVGGPEPGHHGGEFADGGAAFAASSGIARGQPHYEPAPVLAAGVVADDKDPASLWHLLQQVTAEFFQGRAVGPFQPAQGLLRPVRAVLRRQGYPDQHLARFDRGIVAVLQQPDLLHRAGEAPVGLVFHLLLDALPDHLIHASLRSSVT